MSDRTADMLARVSARAVAAKARATEARERNRAADPEFAAWIDSMRQQFPGCRLVALTFPDGSRWP